MTNNDVNPQSTTLAKYNMTTPSRQISPINPVNLLTRLDSNLPQTKTPQKRQPPVNFQLRANQRSTELYQNNDNQPTNSH